MTDNGGYVVYGPAATNSSPTAPCGRPRRSRTHPRDLPVRGVLESVR